MRMKTLSIRQPWAELILQGRKTIDLRTWSTRHRGPLAIYASQTVEKEACLAHGLDPDQITTGAVIGIVELTETLLLDKDTYTSLINQHLSGRRYKEGLYGWNLQKPRRLTKPLAAKGRLHLFEVEIDPRIIIPNNADYPHNLIVTSVEEQPDEAENYPFELRVLPEPSEGAKQPAYRLGLYQQPLQSPANQPLLYEKKQDAMLKVAELGGDSLKAVADQVLAALRGSGYNATDLNARRAEPFCMEEEWGVRLSLLFLAVKPISKMTRVEAISEGIREMTSEELYYWFSKCTAQAAGERAQKALRLLLAEE